MSSGDVWLNRMMQGLGSGREAADRDGRLDHRPTQAKLPRLPGVYTLLRGGRVVFVGKAADPEGEIETRAKGLSFLAPIEFDEVRIVRVHPDRIDEEFAKAKAVARHAAPSRGDPPP